MVSFSVIFLTLIPVISCAASSDATALRGRGAGVRAQADTTNGGGDSDTSADDKPPGCSCDCCDVVSRRPGEIAFGAGVKCSPSDQHSEEMCGAQCSTSDGDHVLQDEVVDVQRFCFFECKPAAGPAAPEKSQCVAFEESEAEKLVDPHGNPVDPAFLYSLPTPAVIYGAAGASANLLSTRSRLASAAVQAPSGKSVAGHPDSVDKGAAKKTAVQGRASAEKEGADTQLEAARLREMERLKQKDLHEQLEASGDGVVTLDPFAAIQDLNSAYINARVAAEKAAIVSSKAVKFYDAGRQKIWKLALQAAGGEVLNWKKKAETKAKKDYDSLFAPTWHSKAIKKAQKASKPYIEGLMRAQESVKIYNEKGFAMANAASALWKESKNEGDAANKLPRDTMAQSNVAQAAIMDAREKAKEAQNMAMQSRQFFATAAETRKGIPQYQYNAQKAAAEAVAGMNKPR